MNPEEEKVLVESITTEQQISEKKDKTLRPARSQAELLAVKQRNVQIALVSTNVIVSVLIALRTFGFI